MMLLLAYIFKNWLSQKSSNMVHMSSIENTGLLSKKKFTTVKDRKEYDEYVPNMIASNFSLYKRPRPC
jgi:hypothetical protein